MLLMNDLVGKPFRDGGRGPIFFDCWGLACEVFRRYGIELPDYQISCRDAGGIDQKYKTEKGQWIKITTPGAPCLVVIRFNQVVFCNHVGVYIGGGRFIHAREKTGVCVESIEHPYWKHAIEGYYKPGWIK